MRTTRIVKIVMAVVVLLPLLIVVLGYLVMSLWNWLTPALFGWHAITFWQAVGLLLLSKILFGGVRGGPGRRMHWRGRMRERWEHMTPEEREKFRQGMGGRCGPFGASFGAPTVGAPAAPAEPKA
ncbi:MAG: hypothetical protein WB566_07755 [Terriglobales bacterium]